MNKQKKILVLGAGRGHVGLINTARDMGIFTIVTTLSNNYPCVTLADSVYYVDVTNKEDILKIAIENKIDGAIICCSDRGLATLGYLNDALNLYGISESSAQLSSNKYLMKQHFIENGVKTAKYYRIENILDLRNALNNLSFPTILKSVDLQGSMGIYIVNSKEDAEEAFYKVMNETKASYCIIEEFLKGIEFGAQAFVFNKNILFIMPHGDDVFPAKTPVPVGHYLPLDIDSVYRPIIEREVSLAIKALNLNNCAVNVDLMLCNGEVFILEITGRAGANCLPELTGTYWDFNYYEMIIKAALGIDPSFMVKDKRPISDAIYAKMIYSPKAGYIKRLPQKEIFDKYPNLKHMMFFVHEKEKIRAFQNSNDTIGEILVVDKNIDSCKEDINNILESNLIINY